jgi:cytochrome c peroxidase
MVSSRTHVGLATFFVLAAMLPAQKLGPVPQPKENPLTAEKAVLGKTLFWDEQLSSDDSMACGTCHRPAQGGTDPRMLRHAGKDGDLLTADDVFGSPGVPVEKSKERSLIADLLRQTHKVTSRVALSNLTAQYAPDLFWDGRASGTFKDPLTGEVLIKSGGALESQSLAPIISTTEMSHEKRTWAGVVGKLEKAKPLGLATNIPPDIAKAIAVNSSYGQLFAAAFGDPKITPARIAFAIASYERTLVPDQTPYDRYVAGDRKALTKNQIEGLDYFRRFRCAQCHKPPMFTDHSFRSIGLRQNHEDLGRGSVTGKSRDAGKFKVPSLRNVGLKPRLMHNGRFANLTATLRVYRFPNRYPNIDPLMERGLLVNHRANDKTPMLDFLKNGLTDPRVANEEYPFDRPVLKSERGKSAGSPR